MAHKEHEVSGDLDARAREAEMGMLALCPFGWSGNGAVHTQDLFFPLWSNLCRHIPDVILNLIDLMTKVAYHKYLIFLFHSAGN